MLLPRAAEITRDTPPGHFNAIFLTDVDALQTDDLVQAVQAAQKQDAFVFWNHHDWKGPEKGDWFEDQVIGRREWLAPLFAACVEVDPPHLEDRGTCWLKVHNHSDLEFHLTRTSGPGPAALDLPPRSVNLLKVRHGAAEAPIEMGYTVDNFVVEPDQGLAVTLRPRED